ncbi:hypothetical protein AX14_000297 [Amanita brunnescens Koide BX004]|nr:hypothetical protein AX14_000297 [Amanita brunnescens Koide BX004]
MKATQNALKNIRIYWLAFIAYWGVVLFGYDTGIAGGVLSNEYFGEYFGPSCPMSRLYDRLALSSERAPISAKIGRKYTLLIFTLIFAVGAILTTVAEGDRGLGEIYAGRVVSGIGIGAISAVAPTYVSECAPKEVRGRITGIFQIMVAIGVMISYFVNLGVALHVKPGVNVWRIPFAIQLIPAGIMCLGLLTVEFGVTSLALIC